MLEVQTDTKKHIATVTFDESKTTPRMMIEALKEGDFTVKGEPKYLK